MVFLLKSTLYKIYIKRSIYRVVSTMGQWEKELLLVLRIISSIYNYSTNNNLNSLTLLQLNIFIVTHYPYHVPVKSYENLSIFVL
jgi:hypothetical protein